MRRVIGLVMVVFFIPLGVFRSEKSFITFWQVINISSITQILVHFLVIILILLSILIIPMLLTSTGVSILFSEFVDFKEVLLEISKEFVGNFFMVPFYLSLMYTFIQFFKIHSNTNISVRVNNDKIKKNLILRLAIWGTVIMVLIVILCYYLFWIFAIGFALNA